MNHQRPLTIETNVLPNHPENTTLTVRVAVEQFVNRKTQTVKGSRTGATDLYRAYTIYAALNGLPWLQQKEFGEILRSLGYEKGRMPGNGAIAYKEIELLEAA